MTFRSLKTLLLLLCMAFCTASLHAQDTSSDPSDIWLNAYMKMREGEQDEGEGNYLAALAHYREAQKLFDYISRAHPTWKQSMIKYRRQTLLEQIGRVNELAKGGSLPQQDTMQPAAPARPSGSVTVSPEQEELVIIPMDSPAVPEVPQAPPASPVTTVAPVVSTPAPTSGDPSQQFVQMRNQLDQYIGANARLQGEIQTRDNQLEVLQQQLQQARQSEASIRATLEKTMNDLAAARQEDKVRELEAQLTQAAGALRQANQKSREYLAALEETRQQMEELQTQNDALMTDRQQMEEQVARSAADLAKAEDDRDKARRDLLEVSREKESLKKARETADSERNKAREQLATVTGERDDLASRLEEQLEKNGMLTSENEELVQELAAAKETMVALNASVEELTNDKATLSKEKEDLVRERDMLAQERNELVRERDELAILLNANDEITGDIKDMLQANRKWQDELNEARAKAAELAAREGNYELEIDKLKRQIESIKAERQQLAEDNNIYQERLTGLSGKLKDMLSELNASNTQLASARSELSEARGQVEAVTAERDRLQEQLDAGGLAAVEGETMEVAMLANNEQENDLLRQIIRRQLVRQARLQESRDLVLDELKRLDVQSDTLLTSLDDMLGERIELTDEERAMFKDSEDDLKLIDSVETGETVAFASLSDGTGSSAPVGRTFDLNSEITRLAKAANYDFSRGNLESAAAGYEEIVTLDHTNVFAHCNLGVIYLRNGNAEQARVQFERALAHDSSYSQAHYYLGVVRYRAGDLDQALESFGESVKNSAENANAHNYIGLIASEKGWGERAETEFKMAVNMDPEHAHAHFNLSVLYATREDSSRQLAEQFYMKALHLGAERDAAMEQFINS